MLTGIAARYAPWNATEATLLITSSSSARASSVSPECASFASNCPTTPRRLSPFSFCRHNWLTLATSLRQRTRLTSACFTSLNGTYFADHAAARHLFDRHLNPAPGSHAGTCRRKGRNCTRNLPGTRPCATPSCASSTKVICLSILSSPSISYMTFVMPAVNVLVGIVSDWHAECDITHYRI